MGVLSLGNREIAIARPDDLDARVSALTGLSPVELALALATASPALLSVTISILAYGEDDPSRADIGVALADADLPAIVREVSSMLASSETSVSIETGLASELPHGE